MQTYWQDVLPGPPSVLPALPKPTGLITRVPLHLPACLPAKAAPATVHDGASQQAERPPRCPAVARPITLSATGAQTVGSGQGATLAWRQAAATCVV